MPVGNSNINFYNSQDNKTFDRELFNDDLFDLLQKVNRVLNADNKIDIAEQYTAVVIDNTDPEMLGRVKANVYGIFDLITDTNILPWCIPDVESLSGDSYIVPEVGQLIRVNFQDGDIYKPIYSSKVKTPMLFGGESPTSKSVSNITANPVDHMVLFENTFSSLQYNRKTSQLIYKNASGMVIQISGEGQGGSDGSTDAGEGGAEPSGGALMIKVGGDSQTAYSLRIDDKGAAITDGQALENFMVIESTLGAVTVHSKGHSQLSSGDAMIGFDGELKFGYTNPGQVAPDPSGIGPWNALPVDPMTGLPHSGSVFIVSGATKDPKFQSDIEGAGIEEARLQDVDDNFEQHETE